MGTRFEVNESVDSIEVIAGTSRRLKFDYKVPELMVENPEIVKASPVSPNEILISGVEPGVSTITISDPDRKLQTITVHVTVDVRKLEKALTTHFPDSRISVYALQTGVILKGYVAKQSELENVMRVAQDYFPTNVINQIQVDGSQMVAIKVKVYEVSRSKLRQLGVDWAFQGDDYRIISSVADFINASGSALQASGQNVTVGLSNQNNSFDAFIKALEQNNIAKLMDQPVLVTQHGRPAEFLSGGEIPISVAAGLGTNAIEFRPFGTKLDIVPLILGQGEMTLEVRAEVSEVANDLSGDTGVPGFRVRRVNTGVRMKAGYTLALAGDFREETEAEVSGLPHLMDSHVFGALFRATQETKSETELVFLITPKFVDAVENQHLPRLGPGQMTTSPSDYELYFNGYGEVPRCVEGCPLSDRFDDPSGQIQQNLLPQVPAEGQAVPVGQNRNVVPQANPYQGGESNEDSSFFGNPDKPVNQSAPRTGLLWPKLNLKRR
jgi:pilus assembly protein CpaC